MRRIEMAPVPLVDRERQIQSGGRHYSEMIGPEDAPTRERLRLFRECMEVNGERLARDLVALAEALAASSETETITVVSIARAGTPAGVVLARLLREKLGQHVPHYSISVIRDRGIDAEAVRWIAAQHGQRSIRFVDGWTGKGTIAHEIRQTLGAEFAGVNPGLWTPLDISGSACWASSWDDYLIPSSLLGGTISGLVSRSVLPREDMGKPLRHACVELPHLRRYDLSRWFVDQMTWLCQQVAEPLAARAPMASGPGRHEAAHAFIDGLMREFGITDRNRVKIGIGETVRVALRRLPERILLRDRHTPDARWIARLAQHRGAAVEYRAEMPCAAVGLIGAVAESGAGRLASSGELQNDCQTAGA